MSRDTTEQLAQGEKFLVATEMFLRGRENTKHRVILRLFVVTPALEYKNNAVLRTPTEIQL